MEPQTVRAHCAPSPFEAPFLDQKTAPVLGPPFCGQLLNCAWSLDLEPGCFFILCEQHSKSYMSYQDDSAYMSFKHSPASIQRIQHFWQRININSDSTNDPNVFKKTVSSHWSKTSSGRKQKTCKNSPGGRGQKVTQRVPRRH
jgi:hypothetical protein